MVIHYKSCLLNILVHGAKVQGSVGVKYQERLITCLRIHFAIYLENIVTVPL